MEEKFQSVVDALRKLQDGGFVESDSADAAKLVERLSDGKASRVNLETCMKLTVMTREQMELVSLGKRDEVMLDGDMAENRIDLVDLLLKLLSTQSGRATEAETFKDFYS